MKVIIEPRGGGKTTKIIKQVIKENGYLLVHNEMEAERLRKLYPKIAKQIFSWKTLHYCLVGMERRKVFIDNADYFITELVGYSEIGAITISSHNKLGEGRG